MHTVQLVKKLFKNIKTKNVVKYIGLAQWALTQPKLQTQLQLCSTKQTTYYNSWTLWCITHHTSSKSDSKTASVNICEWPNSMGSECDLGNFQLSWVPDNGNIWFAECDFLLVFYIVLLAPFLRLLIRLSHQRDMLYHVALKSQAGCWGRPCHSESRKYFTDVGFQLYIWGK